MDIINYKCPSCDGPLTFKSESQEMGCDFCGSSFSIDEVKKYNEDAPSSAKDSTEDNTENGEWSKEEYESMRAYVCPSCGAEIITDETTAATSCPYCDNTTVMPKQFEGVYRPGAILPFKINKKKAIEALKEHYNKKRFLPKLFNDENKIEEIKGIYVPFWLFDCRANGNITFKGETVETWSDGDYNYTRTNYYRLNRGGNIDFTQVPVDGSSKIDDTLMESIEPFNYSELEDFNTAYLSGYLAEKYDVNEENSANRIKERITNSTESMFKDTTTRYSNVTTASKNINIKKDNAQYALLPIWLLNTSYKGKTYTFAMNGQTGKFIGDLPVSKGKFFKWLIGLTLGISFGSFLIALACAAGGII